MPGRFGGTPAQSEPPPRPPQVAEMEEGGGAPRQAFKNTPYSGGPDKEAIASGEPMRIFPGDGVPVQVGAEAAAQLGGAADPVEGAEPDQEPDEAGDAEAVPEGSEEDSSEDVSEDSYEDMTIPQLQDIARNRELSGYSQLNKPELIAMLVEDDATE